MSEKSDWSELVGIKGEEAKIIILQQDPSIEVLVIPLGTPVTRDYRMNRVRIFVDTDGVTVQPPRRG
jgi:hypothetical protein